MEVAEEDEEDEEARAGRARAAKERRARIMAAMASQQKTFMTENATLFEETPSGLREHKASTCEWEMEEDSGSPVCLGPARSPATPLETHYTCILCQVGQCLFTLASVTSSSLAPWL